MTEAGQLSDRDPLSLTPAEFEQLVADIWERRGWQAHVTKHSVDKGVDVIARRFEPIEETHVIQAKRYDPDGKKVGSPEVQQYHSLKKQEGADAVTIVTTSDFSRNARELAADLGVDLIDGDRLESLLAEQPAGVAHHGRPAQPPGTTGDESADTLDLILGVLLNPEMLVNLVIFGLQAALYLFVGAILLYVGWTVFSAFFDAFVSILG